MKKVPTGWITTTLRSITHINYGKAIPKEEKSTKGTYPIIGSSGVIGRHTKALSNSPCIIIGRKGSAGSVNYIRTPCWPIDTTFFFSIPEEVHPIFLYQLLEYKNLGQLDKSTAIPSLSRDDLYTQSIDIPPLSEQTRIVEKLEELLSQLDAGTAELKTAQRKLELYRQSLLKAAVEGSLTADWRKKNKPAENGEQLLERILTERRQRWEAQQLARFEAQGKKPPKDWQKKYPEPVKPDTADLPELPEGWVWASLDMLGEIASGVAKGSKTSTKAPRRSVPYLRVANVQRGHLDLNEIKFIEATEKDIDDLTLKSGDVLFNEGGDRDKLGRGWVWRNEIPNCIHQNHVFRFRPSSPEIQPELLSHHGNTFGKLWFQNAGKQTTNLASINMKMLKVFPVPISSPEEQSEILEQTQILLDSISRQDSAIKKALSTLTSQRQNILRAAFAGELVPQDPNDEPASELLARILAERDAQPPRKSGRAVRKTDSTATTHKPRARKPKEEP